jgi:hypothetical protein
LQVRICREFIPEAIGDESEYRYGVVPTPDEMWLRFLAASDPVNPPTSVFTFYEDTVAFRSSTTTLFPQVGYGNRR